jgi:hypothetical protein
MNGKILKLLASKSFTNNKLDEKKIKKITNELSRKELKAYY